MAGKSVQRAGQHHGLRNHRGRNVQTRHLVNQGGINPTPAPAPNRLGQSFLGIPAQTHYLANFPQGRAAAIGNHHPGNARPVAAKFVIDILDHLFAALMLKVDINIRGFAPLC